MADDHRVEVVRGRLTDERADQILGLWERHGAVEGEAARQRLAEVVCVLLQSDGEVAGVSSVHAEYVELIGKRRFWLYRRFLAEGVPEDAEGDLLLGVYGALDAEFGATEGEPLGVCLLLDDPEVMRRHPEAIWPTTGFVYAGYQADGMQVRIRYFAGARV
jgi:hypothetical protein